jgi:ketosteroid isomerase-like protein
VNVDVVVTERDTARAMSQENVAVVRQMYDAFHSGDAEGAVDHFAPDVTVDATTRPDGEVGKGREALVRIIASWVDSFDDWREEIEAIRDLGGHVLVAARQIGRGKGSGLETELRYALLYRVEDGKISSMTFYFDVADALEAAGLRE